MEEEGVPFEGDMIVRTIEMMKTTNEYEKKTIEEKMAFKADIILEFVDKVVDIIRQRFQDIPEFDPMFLGQHIQEIIKRLFPDHVDEMQFRWVPYLLSRQTAHLFPVCLESAKYVPLRQAAHRRLADPVFKELAEDDQAYITDINDGRMPPGVFGTHHAAWLISDPLKGNEPLNEGAVKRFLEEQKLPSGTRPKNEEEIIAELKGELK
jgi:hypothetical protein